MNDPQDMIDLLSDETDDEIWEPITYEIGQVVRIRVGGECNRLITTQDMRDGVVVMRESHPKVYNNELGMIVHVHPKNILHGHRYRVAALRELHNRGDILIGADFAGIELEPVERTVTQNEWKSIKQFCDLVGHDYGRVLRRVD